MIRRLLAAPGLLGLSAAPALAHVDPGGHGSFAAGLSHPFFGIDHILAMVAVGLWAALLGGRARWLVPAAFVGAMLAGFLAAMAGAPLPLVEPTILASVVVIGLMAAVALDIGSGPAMILVGVFALFHGHAHGGEIGEAGVGAYAAGFAVATALLHAAGLALGLAGRSAFGAAGGRAATRIAGATAAAAGLWLSFAG